jgi:hypothetical protein
MDGFREELGDFLRESGAPPAVPPAAVPTDREALLASFDDMDDAAILREVQNYRRKRVARRVCVHTIFFLFCFGSGPPDAAYGLQAAGSNRFNLALLSSYVPMAALCPTGNPSLRNRNPPGLERQRFWKQEKGKAQEHTHRKERTAGIC